MSHRLTPVVLTLLAGAAAWGPALHAAAPKAVADTESVLRPARAAYVNLAGKGFGRYRFVATPDWAAMLAEQEKTNPEGYRAALDLFAKIRFDVRVGPRATPRSRTTPWTARTPRPPRG